MRLGEPIGLNLDDDGYVQSVNSGSQIEKLGVINPGDRIVKAGRISLGTADFGAADHLISIIQRNTRRGKKSLDLTFNQVRAPLLLSDVRS